MMYLEPIADLEKLYEKVWLAIGVTYNLLVVLYFRYIIPNAICLEWPLRSEEKTHNQAYHDGQKRRM